MWEGREEGRQFRGGAKTRIGFQRATRKWEVGPLYTRARMASGEAGPGRRRQNKSLKKKRKKKNGAVTLGFPWQRSQLVRH